jgi:hypothetical protein
LIARFSNALTSSFAAIWIRSPFFSIATLKLPKKLMGSVECSLIKWTSLPLTVTHPFDDGRELNPTHLVAYAVFGARAAGKTPFELADRELVAPETIDSNTKTDPDIILKCIF